MTALWSTLHVAFGLIAKARMPLVGLALTIEALSLFVMAARWRIVLGALKCRPTFLEALLSYAAGICVCNLTPARTVGGDACRLALIKSRTGAPAKMVATSVVYDRVSEVPGLAALVLVAVPAWFAPNVALAVAGGACVVVLVTAAVRPVRNTLKSWLARAHNAAVGLEMQRSSVIKAVGLSGLVWVEDVVRIMLIGAAFHVGLSPSQAALLSVLRLASGIVPVPAGLGVTDGALMAGLMWLHVPVGPAAAIAIVERAVVYGFGTAFGAVSLALLGGWSAAKAPRTA